MRTKLRIIVTVNCMSSRVITPGGDADFVVDLVIHSTLTGATNDGFLPNTLKILFRLSRIRLDIKKCILSGAVKFLCVRSS